MSFKSMTSIYGTNIDVLRRQNHSQFKDQDDLCLVLKDFMERDDVWVLDLLQDVHLTLYVLPCHPSST